MNTPTRQTSSTVIQHAPHSRDTVMTLCCINIQLTLTALHGRVDDFNFIVRKCVQCWSDWASSEFGVSATTSHNSATDPTRGTTGPTVNCTVECLQDRDARGQCWGRPIGCCRRPASRFYWPTELCFPANRKGLLILCCHGNAGTRFVLDLTLSCSQ